MSVICLCENNSLPRGSIKAPFAEGVCVFYVPFKKLKARHRRYLKRRLAEFSGVYFAPPENEDLLPEQSADERAFFRHMLTDLTRALYSGDSPCLFDATFDEAHAMLRAYPALTLSGREALKVSSELYRETGASVFVSSGNTESFCVHTEGEGGDLCLSIAMRCFYFTPRGPYAPLSRYLGRPLSLLEAARLYDYDKTAVFTAKFIKKAPSSPLVKKD